MWHNEPNGDQSAVLNGMKLVIRKSNGFARYLLLALPRRRGGRPVLLESGCVDNVKTAKEKAVRRATRPV